MVRSHGNIALVTGATGYVGGAVLRLLCGSLPSQSIAGLARNAERGALAVPATATLRIADYNDSRSLEMAFQGVSKLLFVASDGSGLEVVRQHARVIEAAEVAGVEHIVFTSIIDVDETSPFYFTAVYRNAERRITAGRATWTILRCSLYSDFLCSTWLEAAPAKGVFAVPRRAAPTHP